LFYYCEINSATSGTTKQQSVNLLKPPDVVPDQALE